MMSAKFKESPKRRVEFDWRCRECGAFGTEQGWPGPWLEWSRWMRARHDELAPCPCPGGIARMNLRLVEAQPKALAAGRSVACL
jgi:hypothetical protein